MTAWLMRRRYFLPFLISTALVLLPLAVKNTYNLLNSAGDDNAFNDIPSRLYVTHPIPAQLQESSRGDFFENYDPEDGIQAGDLVLAVGGYHITDLDQIYPILQQSGPNFDVIVQRPTHAFLRLRFKAQAKDFQPGRITEIPNAVYVHHVQKDGASDRAGLQRGDLIIGLGNQGFQNARHADFLIRQTLAGETLAYKILRAGREQTINVTMNRLSMPFMLLAYLACGWSMIALGLLLALGRAQLAAARTLAAALFFLGLFIVTFENRGALDPVWLSNTWVLISRSAFFLGLAALLHAGYYFPLERRDLLDEPLLRYTYYPLAFIAIPFSIFLGTETMRYWALIMVAVHIIIRIRYRAGKTKEHAKLQTATLIGSSIAGLLWFFWFFFETQISQNLALFLRILSMLILIGSYTYTCIRFRLLGLEIKRNFQYTILLWGWLAFMLFALFQFAANLSAVADQLPNLRLTSTSIEVLPAGNRETATKNLLLIFFAIIGSGLLYGITKIGARFIRDKFHRGPYDYHKAAHQLTELMGRQLPLEELAEGMPPRIAELMYLKRVGLVFFREDGAPSSAAFGFACQSWKTFCKDEALRLSEAVKKFKAELCVEYLEDTLKQRLISDGFKYIYPIHTGNRLLGCLMVGEKKSEATFRQDDFTFLAATARQAAFAAENASLYERVAEQERLKHELAIARKIQLSSLPQTVPNIEGLSISGYSTPAFEVGGDYYDYFWEGTHQLTVVVGDVSGKGTSAALNMSKMQGIMATLEGEQLGPAEILTRANRILYREMDKQSFITAQCARFDMKRRELRLARAGHLPLFHYNARQNQVKTLLPKGIGLGLENKGLFESLIEEQIISLENGDIFVFLSDGITEALDPEHKTFGEKPIPTLIRQHADQSPKAIQRAVFEAVSRHAAHAAQHDDQTMVVVKVELGAQEPDPTHAAT